MALISVNPATGETLADYPELDDDSLTSVLEESGRAFLDWRKRPFTDRAACLERAASLLRAEAPAFANLMAREMGKPLRDGRAEAEKCAFGCEYYARHAEQFLRAERISTDAESSYVTYTPLGVILGIMPWNFPFWQVFRFAAPTLMAGNACLLKHAPNVQGCAQAIEELLRRAGLPSGVFRNLPLRNERVERVLEHAAVRGVSLTGSVAAGRAVAAKAGSLLKKSVLELGGSDAYVVLADADLERAAAVCAQSRLINAGQSCIAAKRFVVVEPVRKRFEELLVAAMAAVEPGDPLREETAMGPLARADLRENLHRQVAASVAKGARLLLGGRVPAGPGFFYPPTVLTGVQAGMPAYQEETFGPVAAVIAARDESEALRLANDSDFGLGAAVFTRHREHGERLAAQELEAGLCFVNDFVRSDARLPFGGVKHSGYGRELSHFGIREFVNIKTVYVGHAAAPGKGDGSASE